MVARAIEAGEEFTIDHRLTLWFIPERTRGPPRQACSCRCGGRRLAREAVGADQCHAARSRSGALAPWPSVPATTAGAKPSTRSQRAQLESSGCAARQSPAAPRRSRR